MLLHAIKSIFKNEKSIEQKDTDTSLIEQFFYPRLGPGQMWETVARFVEEKGGIIIKNYEVVELNIEDNQVNEVSYLNRTTNLKSVVQRDYFFSNMPVKDLMTAMGNKVLVNVKRVSDGLQYLDFIAVGLLLNKLKIKNEMTIFTLDGLVPDNWIYI